MPKFLIRYRMNPKECFKTAEERDKFFAQVLYAVKAELQSGFMKDWGSYADGSGGYLIYESPKESDVFDALRRWTPQIEFEVREVLTLEQLIELRRAASPSDERTQRQD